MQRKKFFIILVTILSYISAFSQCRPVDQKDIISVIT